MSHHRTLIATAATLSLAGSVLPVGVPGAAATEPSDPTGVDLLRDAAAARGVEASDDSLDDLDAALGGTDAVRSFLALTPAAVDDQATVVVESVPTMPEVRELEPSMAVAAACHSRRDRFSRRIGGVEFQHFTMHTDWCTDPSNGSVTSVSAYRVSYGTTVAGQLQGYRWSGAPSVQEQRRFVGYTATDKHGTTTLYKGRTRMSGHYEICLTGPVGWLCPTSGDSHTETTSGFGSSATSRSYNA